MSEVKKKGVAELYTEMQAVVEGQDFNDVTDVMKLVHGKMERDTAAAAHDAAEAKKAADAVTTGAAA